jgi:hypothetical protein
MSEDKRSEDERLEDERSDHERSEHKRSEHERSEHEQGPHPPQHSPSLMPQPSFDPPQVSHYQMPAPMQMQQMQRPSFDPPQVSHYQMPAPTQMQQMQQPSFDPLQVSHYQMLPSMQMPGPTDLGPIQHNYPQASRSASQPGFGAYYPAPFQAEASHQGPSFNQPSVVSHPPTQRHKQNLDGITQEIEEQGTTWASYHTSEYVSTHPICALQLVCYRTGIKGCELHHIQTVLESRFEDNQDFQNTIIKNPSLISTDTKFFQALRDVYLGKMCSFWRRAFFLKTLRGIRLLSVSYSLMTLILHQLKVMVPVHPDESASSGTS